MQPLRNLLSSVGGTSVMLGLVAMATSVDALYASMKALVCIVGNNQTALKEMERTGGFQVSFEQAFGNFKHFCIWIIIIDSLDSESVKSTCV